MVIGAFVNIAPLFRAQISSYAPSEFTAQVAAVTAALDTWKATHSLPISSNQIRTGIEYPYILFGNMAFYLISAVVSIVLGAPAYIGAGLTLGIGFALGTYSVCRLALTAGVNRYLSVALGFLYASGPYSNVDLFIRNSFPEYLAWQSVPALFLAIRWALQPQAGALALLVGALALAAPFYLHKLVAPHVALALAILGFNAAPWRASTVLRMGLIGTLAGLFSVPGWYPAVRGLSAEMVRRLSADEPPAIFHTTLINLFWPYATNSLPNPAEYSGRFDLQAGTVPLAGFVVAVGMLLTQPRLARSRRLLLPLALFIVNVVLVMGWLRIWEFAPSPLKYIQFAYRLIGLIHFLGFLLFIETLGSQWNLLRQTPLRMQRLAAVGFVIVAVLGVGTYWHWPRASDRSSADIQPKDLGELDPCQFCLPTARSTLSTEKALWRGRELLVPPKPIPVPAEARSPSINLGATVPAALFESSSEQLTVRVFGFSSIGPGADLDQLDRITDGTVNGSSFGTLSSKYDAARQDALRRGSIATNAFTLNETSWTIRPLAEISVSRPGPFMLATPMDSSIQAIAIECSRGVPAGRGDTGEQRCLDLDFLAAPNRGNEFVVPEEFSQERLTRRPLGGVLIDARDLGAGDYLLPTFDYSFVQVFDADGSPVPTYNFDRRPVLRHTGSTTSYTVAYNFDPERLALLSGALVFIVSALIMRMRRSTTGRPPARST